MPVQATVILDSGCILPRDDKNPTLTNIGYFQSDDLAGDIRIVADGKVCPAKELQSLGQHCTIEIRHVRAKSGINREGARASATFHDEILHLKDLYGESVPKVSPDKFDCMLRFESGFFCGAMLKPRKFKRHKQEADGKLTVLTTEEPKLVNKPIAHNVHVYFTLEEGDSIQLARNDQVFWSSSDIEVAKRLEIEFIADNSTAEKFYCTALNQAGSNYWLPNQGDPPPVCPDFPCQPPTGVLPN